MARLAAAGSEGVRVAGRRRWRGALGAVLDEAGAAAAGSGVTGVDAATFATAGFGSGTISFGTGFLAAAEAAAARSGTTGVDAAAFATAGFVSVLAGLPGAWGAGLDGAAAAAAGPGAIGTDAATFAKEPATAFATARRVLAAQLALASRPLAAM